MVVVVWSACLDRNRPIRGQLEFTSISRSIPHGVTIGLLKSPDYRNRKWFSMKGCIAYHGRPYSIGILQYCKTNLLIY